MGKFGNGRAAAALRPRDADGQLLSPRAAMRPDGPVLLLTALYRGGDIVDERAGPIQLDTGGTPRHGGKPLGPCGSSFLVRPGLVVDDVDDMLAPQLHAIALGEARDEARRVPQRADEPVALHSGYVHPHAFAVTVAQLEHELDRGAWR